MKDFGAHKCWEENLIFIENSIVAFFFSSGRNRIHFDSQLFFVQKEYLLFDVE